VYIPHTLDTLKKLGLDSHKINKLGLKHHEHFVQYAFTLVSTRRALEKSIDNSQHNSQEGVWWLSVWCLHRLLLLFNSH